MKDDLQCYKEKMVSRTDFEKQCQTGDLFMSKTLDYFSPFQDVLNSPVTHVAVLIRYQEKLYLIESGMPRGSSIISLDTYLEKKKVLRVFWVPMELSPFQQRLLLQEVPARLKQRYSFDTIVRSYMHRFFGSVFFWKPHGDYSTHNATTCSLQVSQIYKDIGIHIGGLLPSDFYSAECKEVFFKVDTTDYKEELVTQLFVEKIV